MSKNFEKVKGFYDADLWTEGMVWNAVGRWITVEEYQEITGEEYKKE
ncbi:XkdX family protein [Lacrimispora indolis]|nr:XkdX family protein [Lacrimispora indolis]MBE7718824.1 XkdX family protein [Lacrimispora celerecrescens]